MLVYLIIFLISTTFIYFAEKMDGRNRPITILLIIIAICLPCLLAGVRSLNIGTDVLNYVNPIYLAASSINGFNNFIHTYIFYSYELVPISNYEIGYDLFVYLITKIFGNFFSLLFITQLLIIAPIVMGLWKFRSRFPAWLGILTYYLLFYNTSLNMVRQSIAISFLAYGFSYLVQKKYLNYFGLVLLACTFHVTAVIGIIFLGIFIFLNKSAETKKNIPLRLLLIFVISLLIVYVPPLLNITLKILGVSRYSQGYIRNSASIAINQIILVVPVIFLLLFQWKRNKNNNDIKIFLLAMLLCNLALSQLSSTSEFASRITAYFSIFNIYVFPCVTMDKSYIRKSLILALILMYLIGYWYYSYVIMGYSGTIPFQVSPTLNFN